MTLIAIGGGEDKGRNAAVLGAVLAEAKGKKSRILVITGATSYPEDVAKDYRSAFANLGVSSCEIVHPQTPAEAYDPAFLKKIAAADVIFFSGGDQSKLVEALEGTQALSAIQEHYRNGGVVAGTSAGAAAMSTCMITGGQPEEADRPDAITSGTGFGFAEKIIFDTHFMNRGRLPRLFNLLAKNPDKTGIGLDEDTALILRADGSMEVVGSGAVTFVTKNDKAAQGFDVRHLKRGMPI